MARRRFIEKGIRLSIEDNNFIFYISAQVGSKFSIEIVRLL